MSDNIIGSNDERRVDVVDEVGSVSAERWNTLGAATTGFTSAASKASVFVERVRQLSMQAETFARARRRKLGRALRRSTNNELAPNSAPPHMLPTPRFPRAYASRPGHADIVSYEDYKRKYLRLCA